MAWASPPTTSAAPRAVEFWSRAVRLIRGSALGARVSLRFKGAGTRALSCADSVKSI